MSSWVALNVEPDEAVEEEVDDTKELQIEEALKLYHNALKLHAQGPEFYSQAAEAYEALLNSEIFKYPESVSDFKRGAFEDAQTQETSDEATEPIGEFNVNDSTSSLFQTLYLSYKNHGKYVLDAVQESIRTAPKTPESKKEAQKKLMEASRKALQSFGDALERDDSDLNLWRQSARLSGALQSHRLSRYCLESVLADDDNRLELRPEQLGLEEIFAEQRLRSTLEALFDKLSASQIPIKRPKKALLKYLRQHEDPYPSLPTIPADLQNIDSSKGPLAIHTSIRYITPAAPTWESVGKALLQALDDDDEASLSAVPSRSIGIVLPTRGSQAPGTPTTKPEDVEMKSEDDGHEKRAGNDESSGEMLQTTEHETRSEEPEPEPEKTKEPAEPVEEPSTIDQSAEKQLMESLERQSAQPPDQQAENDETNPEELDPSSAAAARKRSSASHLSEMAAFLDRGDATLRLFLWRRLQEAYQAIDYPPKVVSCYLRSIEVVMTELEATKHSEETSRHRQVSLLSWLKALDGIVAKAIPLILEESDMAYECFDQEHLQASMSAVSRLARLLHSFVLYEDSVRVGQTSGRDLRASLTKSLENFKDRMRELYVRCWILQYTLFMEAIAQNKELFDDALEDRIHFLRSVHNALGVRSMCRYSQKKFLKLVKAELFGLETKGDYEFDVCQILYDLHGIKFSPFDGTMDHGCPPEKLDRPTAIMMIDFVLQQANKMNMKDLSKSELKTTIEKMQQAIGPAAKSSSQAPQLTFNRRIVNAYLKAALNPSNLLRAVQGITELSTTVVLTENAKIAAKGWFFLLGHAALTKFRSQKRLSPGSTSELDDAISFFRQDLDHGSGRWETWFRLAQAYDSKLDEDITWTADKINNNRADLATLQRNAIHCYAMAVSTAIRTAEPTAETRALMSDLYSDFGIRLYSSSREPLSMGAFSVEGFPRHFSSEESQQMYKGQPFKEMSEYSVWNFASNLLKRAAVDKSKRWMTHYTLAKCLWKMYNSDDSLRTSSKRVEMQEVLDALFDAINALPQRRDSRSDPIFEPHFKLFSFVHKLVLRGKMTPAEGGKALLATPWARKVDVPENMDAWKSYMMEVLRKFKSADKSNWHHRMGVKAAHLVYDGQPNPAAAIAAKQELSQIFTKTLTIQVWRPEFERPGRHFVYTTRYVYFFVGLLDQLDDRASLDQLLRRVRKKQGDFLNHTKLWEDICLNYAKLIRRAAKINEGHEEGVFKPIGWEEFSTKTARLESLTQLSTDSQPLLELLRDALELKKLNNNLMKITMFEDLIADLYARVYEVNMPQLIEQVNDENKEKMKLDHLLMAGEASAETSAPPTPLPASDTPAPRGRTKGIARRDIQKRADTIVNTKLAPRAPASKFTAPGETDPPSTPHGGSMPGAASTPAIRGPGKPPPANGDGAAGQKDPNGEHDSADESDVGEDEDGTMVDEGNSTLFPAVTDAEEGGSGDEGADEGDGEDDENEGGEGDGGGDGDPAATEGEGDGDEDEEMQDEETKGNLTAEQSANETETEPFAGKDVASKGDPDAMDITPSES
ncbi:hypothetical protein N7467_007166 [Penicillium canescens]|nr:hypothetical protein N7467_007166 [Penicillium canescens]